MTDTTNATGIASASEIYKDFAMLPASMRPIIAENARLNNMTPQQYLDLRGGVSQAGYYGDSYTEGKTLTGSEYAAVLNAAAKAGLAGTDIGAAINAASDAKAAGTFDIASFLSTVNQKTFKGAGAGNQRPSGEKASPMGTATEEQIQERKSALDALTAMFTNAGLDKTFTDKLVGVVTNMYASNVNPNESEMLNAIYNSDAYKQRFSGNEKMRQRMAAGKAMPGDRLLNPAEYIQLESDYREYMQQAGLPSGFYDQPEDFSNFIGNGVALTEVKRRVDLASTAANNADKFTLDALRTQYGLSASDITAYLLDPERALPIFDGRNTIVNLEKAYGSADVAGAAARTGYGAAGTAFSEEIYNSGKSKYAESAFQQAAQMQPGLDRLNKIYGGDVSTEGVVREQLALAGGTEAGTKRRKLASKERAMFQQQSAVGRESLSRVANV